MTVIENQRLPFIGRERRVGSGSDGIDVRPVAGALGAALHGVDPRHVTDGQMESIKNLLHDYEVVFFPGARLNEAEHMAFARRFGEVAIFPVARLMGRTEPSFQVITDGPDSPPEAEMWHTDVTWTETPPDYALLHAEVVPLRGGDTLWASMTAAYEALSPTMRSVIDGLEVIHDNESFIRGLLRKVPRDNAADLIAKLQETYPPVAHPLVRTHPVTGRKALFLGGEVMRRINGMTDAESRPILDFLLRHVENATFHCRWSWQPGDLAVWDERSTIHRSAADHFPQHRSIRRLEIVGSRPFHRTSR